MVDDPFRRGFDPLSAPQQKPRPRILEALKNGLIGSDPLSSPLLAIGASLLESSQPSTTPQNLGGALGLALQQGSSARQLEILNALRQEQSTQAGRRTSVAERQAAIGERGVTVAEQNAETSLLRAQQAAVPGFTPKTALVDGQVTGVLVNDDDGRIHRITEQGFPGQPVGTGFRGFINITGTPEEAGVDPRTQAQKGKEFQEARTNINEAERNIGTITSLSRRLAAPGSQVGLPALVGSALGGAAAQVPIVGEALERGVTSAFAGVTPQELQAIRSQATGLVTENIRQILQESRFTDKERELVNKVLNVTEPLASEQSVSGAFAILTRANMIEATRQAQLTGQPSPFDLSSDAGIDRVIGIYKQLGVEDSIILDIIEELETLQR